MSAHDASEYDAYLTALANLRSMPDQSALATRSIAADYEQSLGYAERAVQDAATKCDEGSEAVLRHLKNAGGFLARLGEGGRIPPRIRASAVPPSATRTEVDAALEKLAQASIALGTAVDAFERRQRDAPPPRSPEPSVTTPAPVPKRHTKATALVVALAALVVVAAIVIGIVSYH